MESKITDEELRRMTREGVGTASVIVELAVPRPRVNIARDRLGSLGRVAGVEPPSDSDEQRADEVKSQARAFLEEVAEAPPVPLAGHGSYAVEVSGQTLDTIVRSPLVRRVHASKLRR